MPREWLVGIDIGGTFTDVVALSTRGAALRTAKVPSRPADPLGALLAALRAVSIDVAAVENLIHGTTRITNAIVEDKLPPVTLLTTEGFEDVLAIARLRRRELYRLDVPPKLPLLVPAERTIGVRERIGHDGEVMLGLDGAAVAEAVGAAATTGVGSVAVALLHAYANAAHEQRLAKELSTRFEHISLSHQINPEAREYERTTSTVLNAAAMPVVVDYLNALLDQLDLAGRFQLFHSAGGWATPESVRARPLVMAMSGPAAGVAACARLSPVVERSNLLTFDMGGTTTDVCLVAGGQVQVTDEREIAGRPMRQPMVAIESIGAGGGSIVRLNAGGLSVGPDSAGADPGPACYAQGGTQATITDANALLGYLNPQRSLGGVIDLEVERAADVLRPIASELGRGLIETALGVVRIANATMARALRRVTVERGVDGRKCTLLAFGGAGPMHAVGLAEEFGMEEVIVPVVSSAFSAYGCLLAEMAYSRQLTVRQAGASFDYERFEAQRDAAVRESLQPFVARGIDEAAISVEHVALMRYEGQSATVPVPFALPLNLDVLGEDFIVLHTEHYGYATSEAWLMEGLRIRVSLPTDVQFGQSPAGREPSPARTASCWFSPDEVTDTPCYERNALSIGACLAGPLLVEDAWSTVVLPEGWSLRVDEYGNLLLRKFA